MREKLVDVRFVAPTGRTRSFTDTIITEASTSRGSTMPPDYTGQGSSESRDATDERALLQYWQPPR